MAGEQRRDLYEVLGVPRDATEKDIRQAYKKMALKSHPDKFATRSEEEKLAATKAFTEIGEAYKVLMDVEKRRLYDMGGFAALDGGSAGRGNFSSDFGGFSFVDASSIFAQFFGGRDPFASFGFGRDPFGQDTFFQGQPFGGHMGQPFGGHDIFQQQSFGHMPGSSMSFSSSSGFGGGGGMSQSVSTSTTIENGKRVTQRTTTIRHADGRIETTTEQTEGGAHDSEFGGFLGGFGGFGDFGGGFDALGDNSNSSSHGRLRY